MELASPRQDLYTSTILALPPEPRTSSHYLDASKVLAELLRIGAVPRATTHLLITKVPSGESNPTYYIQTFASEANSPDSSGRTGVYVLRKQPPGKLLPSAHNVLREAAVLTHIASAANTASCVSCPVAAPLAVLDSPTSIAAVGTVSYLQPFIDGVVYRHATLPEAPSPSHRTNVYYACMDALADLHASARVTAVAALSGRSLDGSTATPLRGLSSSSAGTGDDYFTRMLSRWTRQITLGTSAPLVPDLATAGARLQAAAHHMSERLRPQAAGGAVVLHGDFKLDNIIFSVRGVENSRRDAPPGSQPAAATSSVAAVVDFELCTVGHPIADVAHFLLPWTVSAAIPADPARQDASSIGGASAIANVLIGGGVRGLAGDGRCGIPHAAAMVARYARRRGLHAPLSGRVGGLDDAVLLFAVAAEWFKMGAIAHGVADRLARGNASAAAHRSQSRALAAAAAVRLSAAQAIRLLDALQSLGGGVPCSVTDSVASLTRAPAASTDAAPTCAASFPPPEDAEWARDILTLSDHDAAAALPAHTAVYVDASRRATVGRLYAMMRRFVFAYVLPAEGAISAELDGWGARKAEDAQQTPAAEGSMAARTRALEAAGTVGAGCVAGTSYNAHDWRAHFRNESPTLVRLSAMAQCARLWTLFHPSLNPFGLTTAEYAPLAELTGHSIYAPVAVNCNAPDSGNMETLILYGSHAQRERWLRPLAAGTARSAFAMTEPDTASSDAAALTCTAVYDTHTREWVISGDKWWVSGAAHPQCAVIAIVAATGPQDIASWEADNGTRGPGPVLSDGASAAHAPAQRPTTRTAAHVRHTVLLVPMEAPGVEVVRPLRVFNTLDAPFGHCHVRFNAVRVCGRVSTVLGAGRGFEVSQGRLGPGRVHHCMRAIGLAERAHALALRRATTRATFGSIIGAHGTAAATLAEQRVAIDQARLLVLTTARAVDNHGGAAARAEVSAIKFVVPRMASLVVDGTIQLMGGAGVDNEEAPLADAFAHARVLRIADGPDDVHIRAVAGLLVRKEQRRLCGL